MSAEHYKQSWSPTGLLLADAQREAVDTLSFPQGRNEAWRFTSTTKLLAEAHTPMLGAVGELPDEALLLQDVLDHPACEHLGTIVEATGFAALNLAHFREGVLVFVPSDDEEQLTIRLTGSTGLTTPRVLVVVEEGASLSLHVEQVLGSGLHVPVIEVVAGAQSTVELLHTVSGGEGHCVASIGVSSREEATVRVRSIVTAGEIVRVELTSRGGAHSLFDTAGLVLARGRQHVDHHLHLVHDEDHKATRQAFRNILDDRTRAVFTGQVTVGREVVGSDAQQSVKTILLHEGASTVTRPWLEIDNDDVVASHGATVGQLDEEALFYLRARGLSAQQARRLLIDAVAGEVVEQVPEPFRAAVRTVVDAWMAQ